MKMVLSQPVIPEWKYNEWVGSGKLRLTINLANIIRLKKLNTGQKNIHTQNNNDTAKIHSDHQTLNNVHVWRTIKRSQWKPIAHPSWCMTRETII